MASEWRLSVRTWAGIGVLVLLGSLAGGGFAALLSWRFFGDPKTWDARMRAIVIEASPWRDDREHVFTALANATRERDDMRLETQALGKEMALNTRRMDTVERQLQVWAWRRDVTARLQRLEAECRRPAAATVAPKSKPAPPPEREWWKWWEAP